MSRSLARPQREQARSHPHPPLLPTHILPLPVPEAMALMCGLGWTALTAGTAVASSLVSAASRVARPPATLKISTARSMLPTMMVESLAGSKCARNCVSQRPVRLLCLITATGGSATGEPEVLAGGAAAGAAAAERREGDGCGGGGCGEG